MKTSRTIKATLLLFTALALPFFAQAQEVTQVRETGSFSAIDAGSIFKIELSQGEQHLVEIHTNEEHLENIETQVKGGTLHLIFRGSARKAKVSATIVSPEINSIKVSGAASLKGMNMIESESLELNISGAASANLMVSTPELETKLSGAANLVIKGEARHHTSSASGAAQLKAADLESQTANMKLSGASSARVNVADHLDVNASGTSRVTYQSEPNTITVKTSGVATVNGSQMHNSSASVSGDTTTIRLGNRDLIIVEDEDSEKVKVERRTRKSFRNNWSGFEMGINGYLTPDHNFELGEDAEMINLRYEKSVVVNINLFQQSFPIISNYLGLYSGVGLSFNNYRFDNQTRIIYDQDGLEFVEDESPMRKNKITLTYITVPLMLEFQTGGNRKVEKFHLAGGMILGTRIGSHAKYVYDDEGKKRKEKDFSNFHVPPFRFDLTGRIGWGKVNLFATYALNSLFLADKGPELYPFSVGIRVVNW
ncbi:MAG: GIN domain-containing protein [Bacteroidota bacterium]